MKNHPSRWAKFAPAGRLDCQRTMATYPNRYVYSMISAKLTNAALLLGVLFLIPGCSWITNFVISNTSSADLLIAYTVQGRVCPDNNLIVVPARKANADLKKDSVEWKELTANSYSCDADTLVVKTTLPSMTALRVAQIGTYIGQANYGNEDFQIRRLELKGSEGEIDLKGLKVLTAFKRENKALYVLIY